MLDRESETPSSDIVKAVSISGWYGLPTIFAVLFPYLLQLSLTLNVLQCERTCPPSGLNFSLVNWPNVWLGDEFT
jgi:hypothetical protein